MDAPKPAVFSDVFCTGKATATHLKVTGHATVPPPVAPGSCSTKAYVDANRCVPGPGLHKQGNFISVQERLPHVIEVGHLASLYVDGPFQSQTVQCSGLATVGSVVCERSLAADHISSSHLEATGQARVKHLLVGSAARDPHKGAPLRASRLSLSHHGGKASSIRYALPGGPRLRLTGPAAEENDSLTVEGSTRLNGQLSCGGTTRASLQGSLEPGEGIQLMLVMTDDPFTCKLRTVWADDESCSHNILRFQQGKNGLPGHVVVENEEGPEMEETVNLVTDIIGRSCLRITMRNVSTQSTSWFSELKVHMAGIRQFAVL
jgi:hypothetical protein